MAQKADEKEHSRHNALRNALIPPIAYLLIAGSGVSLRRAEHRERPHHSLEPFDKAFRSAGPLFPFPLLAIRLALGVRQRRLHEPTKALAYATAAAILRVLVYLSLRALGKHVMSDHLLLAASCIAALQVDTGGTISMMRSGLAHAHRALNGASATVAALLALNAHATCAIFHGPVESLLGLCLGAMLFQAPAALIAFKLAC
jgi:hypothetical protein